MKILFLDTSSKFLSLAIAEDKKILSRTHRLLDRKHSLQLIPLIVRILKKIRLPLKKIDGFCVSRGPGSFTGLRIGITTIKALAYVLGKPVVGICSLDILAQNAQGLLRNRTKKETLQVCPIVDAKQNKVYACLYQARNRKIVRKSGYLLLSFEELLKRLKGKVLFLGDAIPFYCEKICKSKKIKPIFAEERFWYPQAAQAVSLALERFRKGKFDDVNSLVPLYLYPRTCQIKRG
ncbi:MAG: tRNA (adenosine(37)-N6)-threonylcarbamoyltransferase complex dimerization subunit type 1 TsaB [Candidatus Omnitrophica bacterium]|nr:tRNA (adenosine(37)-N6)-threonylcarbamoyltransferase complex dimerization subunit type 1 TsaB [Candidatus Omnitrophota bacterium]